MKKITVTFEVEDYVPVFPIHEGFSISKNQMRHQVSVSIKGLEGEYFATSFHVDDTEAGGRLLMVEPHAFALIKNIVEEGMNETKSLRNLLMISNPGSLRR